MCNCISERDKEILELIHKIREERKKSNNRMTSEPIYLVQTRREKHINLDYDSCDTERLYIQELAEDGFCPTIEDIRDGALRSTSLPCNAVMDIEEVNSLDEVLRILDEYELNNNNEICIMYLKYYWETRAYFFSEEEAEDYRVYQSHNLGVSRLFVDNIGYSNGGSMAKLIRLIDREEE